VRALVFAAGLGERMRPLTDATPKPLLAAGGKPLLAWHLERSRRGRARRRITPAARAAVPAGAGRWRPLGLRLHFIHEGAAPLETGGGMHNALPWLLAEGDAPFLAINGDIWCDFELARLPREPRGDAHLVLVDNPAHHPGGDFVLEAGGRVVADGERKLTFAGIGVYRSRLLEGWREVIGDRAGAGETPPRFPIAPLLRAAMARGAVSGEHHAGRWTDVGTPQRLAELEAALAPA